jgi:hypothetical protein
LPTDNLLPADYTFPTGSTRKLEYRDIIQLSTELARAIHGKKTQSERVAALLFQLIQLFLTGASASLSSKSTSTVLEQMNNKYGSSGKRKYGEFVVASSTVAALPSAGQNNVHRLKSALEVQRASTNNKYHHPHSFQ